MNGRMIRDSDAQLALLDALVFFTVILALCSSMVAYVEICETYRIDDYGVKAIDVSELLSVFLRTSIGASVEIASGIDIEMTGRESMADILMVVCDAKLSGVDEKFFAPIPSMILEALVGACPSNIEPHLVVLDLTVNPPSEILVLENAPCGETDTSAASQKMLDHEGRPFLLVLVLEPALGLHDLGV
ncbi:MAG: hypothetical protein KKE24_01100 [Candidatus Thermoplasmatota archaeon]|nr:hypothetical protein [Candidatus Thermoplasmatota archaeon]